MNFDQIFDHYHNFGFLERSINIRIIRILEYNFAHACIPLSKYEANEYCKGVIPFNEELRELSNQPYLNKIHQHLAEI